MQRCDLPHCLAATFSLQQQHHFFFLKKPLKCNSDKIKHCSINFHRCIKCTEYYKTYPGTLCLRRDQSLERPLGIAWIIKNNMKELASVFCRCFTHKSLRTASKPEVNESHKQRVEVKDLCGNATFLSSLSSELSHSQSKTLCGKETLLRSQLTYKLLWRFFIRLKKCDFGIDEACKWSLGLLGWLKK